MALDLEATQHTATVALNLALAVGVGAGASVLSLARMGSGWAAPRARLASLAGIAAILIAILANTCLLWLEAAAMAEVPMLQAASAVWAMLTATHFGLAWMIGAIAMLLTFAAMARGRLMFGLVGVAVFLFGRSMVSHASANGDASLAVLIDWLHLMVICLWVGEVLVAGLLVLPVPPCSAGDRRDCVAYTEAPSTLAKWALVGIFATDIFSARHNLRSPAALFGNPYGTTLLVKLGLVVAAAAALLGGVRRFFVMPGLLAALRENSAQMEAGRFTRILRVESVVLFAVLIAAALLSSTSPLTAA